MHVEGGWANLGLTEHYMHLASMMCLVIKEVKDGCASYIHVINTAAVGVSQRPDQKIAIGLFEERFYARVFLNSRRVDFGKSLEQNSIQRWCRFPAPGKPRHPDSIAHHRVVQQSVDAAEGTASFASILGNIQLPNLFVESFIGDSVIAGKDPKSVQHILPQSIEA
jgi:hypothetical protein